MVSASPAGAGLVMSLDSGRVVVGAGGVGEEGAGHLLALSFDAVAGTDLRGQTCGCVSAEVDRRAAGDQVAQMSVQPVECSAPFAGQFVATIRQQPEHAPVVICADSREIGSPGGDHRDRAGCHGRCPEASSTRPTPCRRCCHPPSMRPGPRWCFNGHWPPREPMPAQCPQRGCRARSRRKVPERGRAVDQRPANPIRGPVSALAPVLRKPPRRYWPADGPSQLKPFLDINCNHGGLVLAVQATPTHAEQPQLPHQVGGVADCPRGRYLVPGAVP